MLLSTGFKEYFQSNDAVQLQNLSMGDETPVKDSDASEDIMLKEQQSDDLNVVKKRESFR